MEFYVLILLLVLLGESSARDTTRSKRQLGIYYLCGSAPNEYLSQSHVWECDCCATGAIRFMFSKRINSFKASAKHVYVWKLSELNFIVDSLFAVSIFTALSVDLLPQPLRLQFRQHFFGSNQYNPCASSCCAQNFNFNSYNPYNTGFGPYGPHNYVGIGNGAIPNNDRFYNPYATTAMSNGNSNMFTGRVSNNVLLCGGIEPIGGTCHDGQCPNGHICIAGNICCRCAVGASAGTCTASNGNECPIGYSCTSNGQCCASQVARGMELLSCINNSCNDGFQCGKGNLCYPITSF
uniref:CC domain-containing protein n=1 Tax=Heterorhabditis bacteriophora TaxID=37862 RepID=A0A1I7XHP7_HETBA